MIFCREVGCLNYRNHASIVSHVSEQSIYQLNISLSSHTFNHRRPKLTVCVNGRIARFIHIRLCMGTPGLGDLYRGWKWNIEKPKIHILSGIFGQFRYSKVIQRQIFIFLNILKSYIPFMISAVSSRGRSRSFRKGGPLTKL